ncbi:MAG: FAD-dependent oxidoreductase [Nitrososphaerota archaeon]|jgi:NADPH-dependent 2,4-dienoyl-CoA reductase/sulfur reductase-like enzyme|nr:FAD-dependent oxidoreductase [Nitrososphaerota archaeon]MDG7046511.1 FAD-dependent oxidoreductase [Nitrososphaerota archaeon]MDG7048131.1 FAD-dependent oxidoreductase [Nitrososphaerota archaeon]
MKSYTVIGGGAAGMSAASRIRKRDPDSSINVFEESGYVSYGPCGIPYFIQGLVNEAEDLVTYTPEFFKKNRRIDVSVKSKVLGIDAGAKSIRALTNGKEITLNYDILVLATGSSPFIPEREWLEAGQVFTVRYIEDAITIKKRLADSKNIGIVGGGYIGIEMAEGFSALGKKVTIMEAMPQIMPNMDADTAALVEKAVIDKGVKIEKGLAVKGIYKGKDRPGVIVETDGGRSFFDGVILSMGVKPNTDLARTAGLKLGSTKAIAVDDHMLTSDPSIFAAGDNVEIRSLITGGPVYVPLAPEANKEGYVAGTNATGGNLAFPGTVGSSITKFYDMEIGGVGLTEKAARAAGMNVRSVTIEGENMAGYYPGGSEIKIKLVYLAESKVIVGAQALGRGAWGRISALSVAIQAKFNLNDLFFSGIPYAPPFSPVWDSVIIAARVGKES